MKHDFTTCYACRAPARKTTGAEVYPHRADLASKVIWKCDGCGAHVGCHPGTDRPLGRLANAELRAAKVRAHAAFDPLWRAKMAREGCSQKVARSAAYGWLAAQLAIDPADCHIGYFDADTCQRVVEICSKIRRRAPA